MSYPITYNGPDGITPTVSASIDGAAASTLDPSATMAGSMVQTGYRPYTTTIPSGSVSAVVTVYFAGYVPQVFCVDFTMTPGRAANLDNLDAKISTAQQAIVNALPPTPPTTDAISSAVWANTSRTLTSFGTLINDVATAVWTSTARTLTSFGTLIADISASVVSRFSGTQITIISPSAAAEGESITIIAGADYRASEALNIVANMPSSPDLSGATAVFHIGSALQIPATILTPGTSTQQISVELAATQTAALMPRNYETALIITLDNGHIYPSIKGSITVQPQI